MRLRTFEIVFLALCLLLLIHIELPDVEAQNSNQIERVSVSSGGAQSDIDGGLLPKASISENGNTIAFMSYATNLVSNDTNGDYDIFAHDRQTGTTTRVSIASDGTQGNDYSTDPSISSDGRYVAFASLATNLIVGGASGVGDVYVHDRQLGLTTHVSIASDGTAGNLGSGYPSISANGRYVAFESIANNLVVNDTNGLADIFVHDRITGQMTRVSVASNGAQANSNSALAAISGDGSSIAFYSNATNLVANDTNSRGDIFVHNRLTGETTRVSVSSGGGQGNGLSNNVSISAGGRYVAFRSVATNLVPNDTNGLADIFVHDLQTGETTRENLASNGTQSGAVSDSPSISSNGRYIVFASRASNLAACGNALADDIFVHDRQTGETTCVSVTANGAQANGSSFVPLISPNGQYVAFVSFATNLVPGDTNNADDVFVALNILSISVVDLTEKAMLNYYTTPKPSLTWNRISWATGYEIAIDMNSQFNTDGHYTRPVNGLSHTVEIPLAEGVWYWRVRAKQSNGVWGMWGTPERFTVDIP